jgi:hypothetical protein
MKELIIDIPLSLHIHKLKSYKKNEYNITTLVTPTCCIEIANNKIKKKILLSCNSYENPTYFKDHTLYVNECKYKYQYMNNVPVNHQIMSITYEKFKLQNKSNVSFIVETTNNEIVRCYFNIIGDENDIMIKEEIISFLSILS